MRATALSSALIDLRGWLLLAHCAQCRAMRRLSVDVLADQVGSDTLLRDLLPKLRCYRCDDPPRAVKLSDGGGVAAREVWVLGEP
jgi:hypothetical protein